MRITGIELGLVAALLLVGALTLMQLTNMIWRGGRLPLRLTVTILGCSSALTDRLIVRLRNAVARLVWVRGGCSEFSSNFCKTKVASQPPSTGF